MNIPCTWIPKDIPPTASWSLLSFNLLQITKNSSILSLLFNTLQRSWLAGFLWTVSPLKHHKSLSSSSSVGFTQLPGFSSSWSIDIASNGPKMSPENRDEELRNHFPVSWGRAATRKCFPHGFRAYIQSCAESCWWEAEGVQCRQKGESIFTGRGREKEKHGSDGWVLLLHCFLSGHLPALSSHCKSCMKILWVLAGYQLPCLAPYLSPNTSPHPLPAEPWEITSWGGKTSSLRGWG